MSEPANFDFDAPGSLKYLDVNGDSILHLDGINLGKIAFDYSTPTYVYSERDVMTRAMAMYEALDSLRSRAHLAEVKAFYAVKANPHPTLLRAIYESGINAEASTIHELYTLLENGWEGRSVIFEGCAKTWESHEFAVRHFRNRKNQPGIDYVTIESHSEYESLRFIAESLKTRVPVGIRVNLDVSVETHPKIATGSRKHKFGVPEAVAIELYQLMKSGWLNPKAICIHVGSQLTDINDWIQTVRAIRPLVERLREEVPSIDIINLGGGFPVSYGGGPVIQPSDIFAAIAPELDFAENMSIYFEPGRSLVAPSGILLTAVEYCKPELLTPHVIVNASMATMVRSAMYGASHPILNINRHSGPCTEYMVGGSACESGDVFGNISFPVDETDILAICCTGAYGACMASRYNGFPLPKEVVIRANGSVEQLER